MQSLQSNPSQLVIKLRQGHSSLEWVLKEENETPGQMDSQGACHVTRDTEITVMHCQPRDTRDCQPPPETDKEGFSPGSQRSMAQMTHSFQTSGSENCERINSVV